MKQKINHFRRDQKGAGAMEFALAAPVLFTMIVGISQMGTLFFANAGLSHAVSEGARIAANFPTPADDVIKAAILDKRFGLVEENIVGEPTIVPGTDTATSMPFLDISLSYEVPLNFIFFTGPEVTLTETRRVFRQIETPAPVDEDDEDEDEGE
ncbi:MAG TPA: TadE/TadG family type IV pilus assembly protein, partial [Allosphingosinicella sp.]